MMFVTSRVDQVEDVTNIAANCILTAPQSSYLRQVYLVIGPSIIINSDDIQMAVEWKSGTIFHLRHQEGSIRTIMDYHKLIEWIGANRIY
jgi:hypothetical protein